jgi:hypothetical protein
MQTAADVRALARRYARTPTTPVVRFSRPEPVPAPVPVSPVSMPPTRRVVSACAQHYGVSVTDILGVHRSPLYTRPRHVAMYLAKEDLKASFPQIAKRLGRLDHTTALHGWRKIKAQLETDEQLQADVKAIRERLGAE